MTVTRLQFGNAPRNPLRWLWRGVLLLLLLPLVAAGIAWYWASTSLPVLEGQVTVQGLAGPVSIDRDSKGIPWITATRPLDAFYGLGYAHAQDRLVQMELMRRLGKGQLAAAFGRRVLTIDKLTRSLGLARKAEADLARLSSSLRTVLDSYAAGVNAFLETHPGALPPEFLALGEPAPWTPLDSMLWGKLMALQLSENWHTELLRARLARHLSPEQLEQLWPPLPADAPTTLAAADMPSLLPQAGRTQHAGSLPNTVSSPNAESLANAAPVSTGADAQALAAAGGLAVQGRALLDALPPPLAPTTASNIWAVSGRKTRSGHPVLANDPHLGFSAPIQWYLARLQAPGLTLVGGTVPGTPLMIVGHNGHIAWGLTTTHSDTQDIVVERLDPSNPNRYLTPDGPRPFAVREEVIEVADEGPVPLTVRYSRHGPVLSDLLEDTDSVGMGRFRLDSDAVEAAAALANKEAESAEETENVQGAEDIGNSHVLTLAWPALSEPDLTAEAFWGINRARSWQDFTKALRHWVAPQQNIFYADRAGHIGFYAPGLVPQRNGFDGSRPVAGWTRDALWRGFIPFDELPHSLDPERGMIINANNRPVPPGYPHRLASDWLPGYRAARIEQMLTAATPHDVDGSARIQLDTLSLMARDLLPLMLDFTPEERVARYAHGLLGAWDGDMLRHRVEPLLFAAWVREFGRALYSDELGEDFEAYWGWTPQFLRAALTRHPGWCDRVDTRDKTESCPDILADTLSKSLDFLAAEAGHDMNDWHWGSFHQARFANTMLRFVPVIGRWTTVQVPTHGGAFTINRGSMRFRGERAAEIFTHVHGPGLRVVFDLADLNGSRFNIATGQSGHLLSSHYDDQVERWRDGIPVLLGAQPEGPTRRLVLEPR